MSTYSLALLLGTMLIAGCQSVPAANGKRVAGLRLSLTPKQLDLVGAQAPLPLTAKQRQQIRVCLGKEVSEARIVYDLPDGEISELGYNLALRDRAGSIVILPEFAMSPDQAARKHAENLKMIGPPERPPREHTSFFIDAQGRIWRLMSQDAFTAYTHAHHSDFGYVTIRARLRADSSALASRDTQRFMRSQLSKTSAIVSQ